MYDDKNSFLDILFFYIWFLFNIIYVRNENLILSHKQEIFLKVRVETKIFLIFLSQNTLYHRFLPIFRPNLLKIF